METKHTATNRPTRRRTPRRKGAPLVDAQKVHVLQIMSHPAITVRPEMSVETVVETMLENGLSRLPVVNDQKRLVGMVSKTDLLSEQFQRGDTSMSQPVENVLSREGVALAEQGIHIHEPQATVAEVMRPTAVTLNETMTIAQAAEVMVLNQLHGVPVLSLNGAVTGMLSLLDIVGWVAGLV